MSFGLSGNEAEVFLICLKTGETTANRITELAELPRSTVYDILTKLKQYGLVTSCVIKNKINFSANDPEVMITILDEKKNKVRQIMPEMKKIQNKVGAKPVAEVHQGKIAVIKLLDEILDNAKSLKVIGSQGNALEKIGYHPEKFRNKRLENKIKIKQILEISEESLKLPPDKFTEIRFMNSLSDSREATFIFGDCVYHLILQHEISAIKITSNDHAKATEIMFDEMWKIAKTKNSLRKS